MSDGNNENNQLVVLNFRDDPEVTNPVSPKTGKTPGQCLTQLTRREPRCGGSMLA
jgi:hypothetical protein